MSKRLSLVMMLSIVIYGASMWSIISQASTASVKNDSRGVVVDVKVANKSDEVEETTEELTTTSETTEAVTEAETTEAVTEAVTEEQTVPQTTEPATEAVTEPVETEAATTEKITEKTTKEEAEEKTKKQKEEETTKKKEKETEKKTKEKVNNTVPSQSENNKEIGSENMNLIRNTVINMVKGAKQSENMKNLAIYMANNGMSDAKTAADKVCGNNTLSVNAKTAKVTSNSADVEDIMTAATNAADKLSGSVSGDYGVGISVSFSDGKYQIYVVLAYEK